MRIAIREQLVALVTFAVLIALAVVSIPTWIYVYRFVIDVESKSLSLTASLKASRIAAELELVQTSCLTISSRLLVQSAFLSFYNGTEDWEAAKADLVSAFSASNMTQLLQARLYSRNSTGNKYGLLNVTGQTIPSIKLPYRSQTGSEIFLGDYPEAYPKELYPNLTYVDLGMPNRAVPSTTAYAAYAFPDVRLSANGGMLLGPLVVNDTFALLSVTVPVRDNSNQGFILGYMTVVAMASSLINIADSREGLGKTGIVLLVGPTSQANRFDISTPASNQTYLPNKESFGKVLVHYVLPANPVAGQEDRHSLRNYKTGGDSSPFKLEDFPAVFASFGERFHSVNNASSMLSTTNEQGAKIAAGFARTNTSLANWTVVVEQSRHEAFEAIDTLRNILLGCVFGTAGLIFILTLPCAHLSVMPIRKLKAATEKTIQPPGYAETYYDSEGEEDTPGSGAFSQRSRQSKKGLIAGFLKWMGVKRKPKEPSEHSGDSTRRIFKIPGKVEDRKHRITDELTELTKVFNDMSDELVKQYTSLDQKVAERTRELEISKKAAEAANESKTLFIANISHELKTPLNGILGMCAVCMEENDLVRIKQSLKTLYKSGDLLLHLLEDLLSFSKNQIGQQLNLEEKEFRLGDIRSQVLTIFDKQVRESHIDFSVTFVSSESVGSGHEAPEMEKILPAIGPSGMGRLKDMCLWGDQHRILQVIINLVSNSLKFTPAGGKVELRIKCLGEAESQTGDESRTSSFSRGSRVGRSRHRLGSSSSHSTNSKGGGQNLPQPKGTAIAINPMEPKSGHIHIRERSPTPPPANARSLLFEFEVEDTGPGIPEHMQERVFEPFVQGDLGLSKKFGGTGLGLSICQQLAVLMGGVITLRSTMGIGTTFTMQIPLKYVKDRSSSTASSSIKSRPPSVDAGDVDSPRNSLAKAPEANKASVLDQQPRLVGLRQPFFAANPTPPSQTREDQMAQIDRALSKKEGQGKLKVLVADDNSTNIEVVSKMLKLEDVYDVTIAKDGQEAYDMVKATMANNEQFDVIFMDIQMPNLDGLQSTRLIRQMGYKSPIVALTAFAEESNVRECMESGMDEFLSKPIRRPALKQVLKKFATIPEEPETVSLLTRKTTPEEGTSEGGPEPASGARPAHGEETDSTKSNGAPTR